MSENQDIYEKRSFNSTGVKFAFEIIHYTDQLSGTQLNSSYFDVEVYSYSIDVVPESEEYPFGWMPTYKGIDTYPCTEEEVVNDFKNYSFYYTSYCVDYTSAELEGNFNDNTRNLTFLGLRVLPC